MRIISRLTTTVRTYPLLFLAIRYYIIHLLTIRCNIVFA